MAVTTVSTISHVFPHYEYPVLLAALTRLDQEESADPSAIVSYQESLDRSSRSISRISQDIVSNALGSAGDLSSLAHEATTAFAALIADARRIIACTPNDEVDTGEEMRKSRNIYIYIYIYIPTLVRRNGGFIFQYPSHTFCLSLPVSACLSLRRWGIVDCFIFYSCPHLFSPRMLSGSRRFCMILVKTSAIFSRYLQRYMAFYFGSSP